MFKRSMLYAAILFSSAIFADIPYSSIGHISVGTFTDDDLSAGNDGTGVLLDRTGLFVTNVHIIEPCLRNLRIDPVRDDVRTAVGQSCRTNSLRVRFPLLRRNAVFSGAQIVSIGGYRRGPYRDWVLLRLNGDFSSAQVPRLNFNPADESAVRLVGFPSRRYGRSIRGGGGMYESAGVLQSPDERLSIWTQIYQAFSLPAERFAGLFQRVQFNFFSDNSQLFHTAPIYAGYSGGGLFNAQDELIGIAWGSIASWDVPGRMPNDLKPDPSKGPEHPGNRLAAAIRIGEVLSR